MFRIRTPWIGRRAAVSGLCAALAAAATGKLAPAHAAPEPKLTPTPGQTEGPFYPPEWLGDIDNDLVLVKGEDAKALGTVLHIRGRVLDRRGEPIEGAIVEIWQCDAKGVYHHPWDERGRRKADSGFQGRGRVETDAEGRYVFRTIKPAAYSGRTPHIHFKIMQPGGDTLVTQMYFAGEPANARDFVLERITDPAQRANVIVPLEDAGAVEPGALSAQFDIVLG
ncbi:protocatechuate 3,4-dioxygenase [Dichotomicrobium thermohalophilum]|uniref:Protocatechuate 3,4-dioxygenase beta subunit n=1 Tax=Dichotomicrobium thermohalophilum TaxID=933063 RepID=A0A397Q501_9HYPH|nr:protocatechuate 3,4-dioxygenase [Dichotomicrobium thermohalophilum]RIA56128.1 protocatechuate 3,4-dioxygenase beta subunit [Dichotomicrobium thermohalophilum]